MGHGNSAKSYIISLDPALEGLARVCNSEQGNTLIVVIWAQPRVGER